MFLLHTSCENKILFNIYKLLPLYAILDDFYKTDILFFALFWKSFFCLWAAIALLNNQKNGTKNM